MITEVSTCPRCDTSLQKSYRFCPGCGSYLDSDFLSNQLLQVLNSQREGSNWKAMEKLKDLTQTYPGSALVHKLLGNLYFHLGMLDWAIDHYWRAIEIDKNYVDAHYDLGIAYYHHARIDEAIDEFLEVLRLDPDYHAAHYRLGICYQHASKHNAAIQHLKEATVVTPEYVMAFYHLGAIYFEQNKLDEAESAFNKVLTEDPNDISSVGYLKCIEAARKKKR
jgi:tetratricopeptide (TPR) repeat protein